MQQRLYLWLALSFLLAVALPAQARDPLLMVLEYADRGQTGVAPITSKLGDFASPTRGRTFNSWILRAGEAVRAATQPEDRYVEIFQENGGALASLCTLQLR